jgi:hypothetical protein
MRVLWWDGNKRERSNGSGRQINIHIQTLLLYLLLHVQPTPEQCQGMRITVANNRYLIPRYLTWKEENSKLTTL